MRQDLKEEKKRLAQERKKIAQDEERSAKEEGLAQEKKALEQKEEVLAQEEILEQERERAARVEEALAQKEEASAQERERLAQEERILKVKQLETTEEQEERARAKKEDVGATLMEQYKRKDQEYVKERNEKRIEKQREAQLEKSAEAAELNQPVNFEKYKLQYHNMKAKAFVQAMAKAKITRSFGAKHNVYRKIVDGKVFSSLRSCRICCRTAAALLRSSLSILSFDILSLCTLFCSKSFGPTPRLSALSCLNATVRSSNFFTQEITSRRLEISLSVFRI
jgi:hypothetical protein